MNKLTRSSLNEAKNKLAFFLQNVTLHITHCLSNICQSDELFHVVTNVTATKQLVLVCEMIGFALPNDRF